MLAKYSCTHYLPYVNFHGGDMIYKNYGDNYIYLPKQLTTNIRNTTPYLITLN